MKTALIVGRAKTVWDEVAAAQAMCNFDKVLVTGPVVVDYPGEVDAWVWFHTELFKDIGERRARNGYSPVKEYWSVQYRGRRRGAHDVDVKFLDWNGGGASGMVAVIIALDKMDIDRVALAGMPMTIDGGQYDSTRVWAEAEKHRHSWVTALPKLQGRVRSFSGWTLKLLGGEPPTKTWLTEEIHAAA